MQAEAKPLSFILNEGLIRIPFFQRSYVWDEPNWIELFDDLKEDKSHFLGSLIFKQQNAVTGQAKEVLLIDGQQRLTTVSILLRCLYDSFDDEKKKNVDNTIFGLLYFKRYATDSNYEAKIKHSKNDLFYYEKILLRKKDCELVIPKEESENKLFNCYKYFSKAISDLNESDAVKLFNKLTSTDYKMFVIIDLGTEDDEQEIFDTINSSGIILSSADIVKNALFQRALSLESDIEKVSEAYQKYWIEVFQKDGEVEKAWLKKKNTGRVKRDNIEILLHSFAVIKGIFNPEKDTLANLSSLYKKQFESLDYNGIISFLQELSEYGNIYYESFISETELYTFEKSAQRTIHIIEELELSTFYPLVMFILKEGGPDKENHLKNLERYILRRAVVGELTKSYNKDVKSFINNLQYLESESLNHITDEQVEQALKNVKNSLGRLILFWIELYIRNNNNQYDIKELRYNYTLEHVMPIAWETNWSTIPICNLAGTLIEDKNLAKEERDNNIRSIGNMILLRGQLNSSISNSSFIVKVQGKGNKKGINYYSELAITKSVIQDIDGTERKKWDEKDIRQRTSKLIDLFKNIW